MFCKVVKYNPKFGNKTLSGVNILTALELKLKPLIAELKLDWPNLIFFPVFTEILTLLTNNNNLFC